MKILFFLFSFSTLFGVTIYINNDSLYTLNATVYSKDRQELTSVEIRPSHIITWSDSFYDAKDYSKGPYIIIFTCPNGDEYGTVFKVAQNTTVYAQRARGRKRCGKDSQPNLHRDFEKNQPHRKY